jgi:hypothetical protein
MNMNLQSRRDFLKKCTRSATFFCTVNPLMSAFSSQSKRPNIVLLIADDCSFWDIGCYGSKDSITPNIDNLAKEGIRFNQPVITYTPDYTR